METIMPDDAPSPAGFTATGRPAEATAMPADAAVAAARARIEERLARLRRTVEGDPFANPIQLLALGLSWEMRTGELDEAAVETLLRHLTLEAFTARAERMRAYLGELDPERNAARLAELFRAQVPAPDGAPLPFREFAARVERTLYGFVVTAHPTFGLTTDLQHDLMALTTGRDRDGRPLDADATTALLARVGTAVHRPDQPLDLAYEHGRSLEAVRNLQGALRRAYGILFDVAAELYPEDWRALVPQLVSVASWVGYDTDGRADISWRATFEKRLTMQVAQLERHLADVRRLRGQIEADAALMPMLELVEARLALALKSAEDERRAFAAEGDERARLERLAGASRAMAGGLGLRLRDACELESLLTRCLGLAHDPGAARALAVLRAEVRGHGLAAARTHVRINALQLHNAIRKQIGMEHPPDDPSHRLTYLEAVTRLIAGARRVEVNFGTLEREKATAKRAFMVIAQMLKYLDAAEAVRFLVAECETPLTLLAALYFARLFGVDGRVDISPLFETRKALERGASILDGALSVEAYRDYVRRRGRLCVQTGYSDAGRYLGQTAASVAIERIRLELGEVLARHGLVEVEVVIFDTHGESIGRGAHPSSLLDRLRYLDTPESRRRFALAGIRVVQETSYQGGDGYLFFLDPTSAFAVLTRVLEHVLGPPPPETPDLFYEERAYVDEFFAAIRAFNDGVIENPAYAALLGAFGTNLLYPAGSRSVRRQYDSGLHRPALDHPSQIRAIPHNAILQQLGILANTIGGVGQAVAKDPERFHALYRGSARFRRLMSMVEHAFMYTDLVVVRAYLDRFDPGFWLARAESARNPSNQGELVEIARHMERIGLHERLFRIFRILQRDYIDLASALRAHRKRTRSAGETPIAVDQATRDNLHMLHALRLALMERLARRAVHVPDFSDRHVVTREEMVGALLQLEVEPALRMLGEIFPIIEAGGASLDWGEPSTYEGEGEQSYWQEHERLFRPMGRDYDLVRRIGSAIIHHVGAVG
jgi:phosphoenolpyruvate carboxylase